MLKNAFCIPPSRAVAAAWLSLLAAALLVAGCAPSKSPDGSQAPEAPDPSAGAPEVLGVVPFFELLEPTGLAFPFEELRGRIWIAGHLGPGRSHRTEAWAALQERLDGHALGDEIRLVSFAPPETSPQALADFGETAGVDPLRWHLLTGSPEELARLDARLGGGDDAWVLVDRLGRIRGRFDAGAVSIDRVPDAAEGLAAEARPLPYPEDIMNPPWLEARGRAQKARLAAETASGETVRHDFSFTDRLEASGITFRNHTTEDSGKRYKSNHYDHGNGLLVADVDGDSRPDLYFLTQLGGNELWRNLGDGRFENITDAAGLAVEDRVSVSGAFGDVDNDGDPDLFVTTVRQGNLLFENDGRGRFTDITESAGVGEVAHSSAAVFFDYDRDGRLDLLVTHVGRYTTDEIGPGGYLVGYEVAFDGHLKPERAERSTLYRNLGDLRFEDVSEQVGLVEMGWNGDASLVDLDEDGWPDLYLTDMQGHDDVYRNVGGERFERWREKLFPETPFGTMGIQVFDVDNDLQLDIFLTDMHTDMVRKFPPGEEKEKLPAGEMPPLERLGTDGRHVRGNALFLNRGDRFEEVSDALGAENYWPWGLSSGDLNADGFEDAFLTSSMSYGWRYATDSLLLNDRGRRFVGAEFVLGVEPRRGFINGIAWHELDCDDPAEDENYLCRNREGEWQVWGALGSRSSAILDLDADGDLDIVVGDFNAPPRVLISDLAERGPIAYLEVELEGRRSNRDGLGASVVLYAGERAYRKVKDGNSGYLSFSPQPLYFGLGDARQVDRLEVTWPSGLRQEVAGPIAVNQRLEIVEEAP